MAVYLSLRQVRNEILSERVLGSLPPPSDGAKVLLEQLFNDIFADLVGPDPRWNWSAALADQDPDPDRWQSSLIEHCYRRLVAHRLERHKAELQSAGADVCYFWVAVQALNRWVVERLWMHYQRVSGLPAPQAPVKCELPLELEVQEAGWTDSVRLTDIDESLWRAPEGNAWYAVTLDFADARDVNRNNIQACLYYLLLRAAQDGQSRLPGSLAVATFRPDCTEQLYEAGRLDATLKQVKTRLGQFAGVVPNWLKTVSETRQHRQLPPQYSQIGNTLLETLREYGAPARLAGPPQVETNALRFTVIPGEGVQGAKIKQLADALKLRLRLKTTPLIDTSGAEVLISIERAHRPIVFYWPG
jgi:hypothetical protein